MKSEISLISCTIFAIVLVSIFNATVCHEFDFQDRAHLREHLQGQLDLDLTSMSERDLQMLYFQSHDAEANNKLDGCELVQSLLHFHTEESTAHGEESKVFSDAELSVMVDTLLSLADKNEDGFIDFPEFVSGGGYAGL